METGTLIFEIGQLVFNFGCCLYFIAQYKLNKLFGDWLKDLSKKD